MLFAFLHLYCVIQLGLNILYKLQQWLVFLFCFFVVVFFTLVLIHKYQDAKNSLYLKNVEILSILPSCNFEWIVYSWIGATLSGQFLWMVFICCVWCQQITQTDSAVMISSVCTRESSLLIRSAQVQKRAREIFHVGTYSRTSQQFRSYYSDWADRQ